MTKVAVKGSNKLRINIENALLEMARLKSEIEPLEARYAELKEQAREGMETAQVDSLDVDVDGMPWRASEGVRATETMDKPALFREFGEANVRRFIKQGESKVFTFRPIKPGQVK